MRTFVAVTALALSLFATPSSAQSTLDGLPRVAQWTDFENQAGELPVNIWGACASQNADRVGIRVDFNNGLTGFATYSGTAGRWNVSTFPGIDPDSAGGFLASCTGLHFLFDNKNVDLPMAWESCSNAFSSNFDLDADEDNGSNFRASTTGWVSATFQTYCGTFTPPAAVPATSPLLAILLGAGIAALGASALRRRAG